jgi:hypothetical protein
MEIQRSVANISYYQFPISFDSVAIKSVIHIFLGNIMGHGYRYGLVFSYLP